MKAITYTSFGPADEVLTLQDLPAPSPADGEVLVDLAYSGVNPSDVRVRAGGRPGVTKPPFPVIIPHSDGSGTISAVGTGVPKSRIGERVWIWNGQWHRASGTAATQIALPSEQAIALPENTSLQTGATLGIPGLTACHTVFSGGDISGQTLLIHGGAGTVGLLAVQLAKWGGANVISTSSPRNFDRVHTVGADTVLDYSDPDLATQILNANGGRPVNRIIDVAFGRNIETNTNVIAENGRINAYGSIQVMSPVVPFYALMFKSVTLEAVLIYLLPDEARAKAIDHLTRALTEGALHCPIQKTFELADCAAAHQAVEAGGRTGSILVEIA